MLKLDDALLEHGWEIVILKMEIIFKYYGPYLTKLHGYIKF